MKFSKDKQIGYKKKKDLPAKEGSDTESPVQEALDMYIELKALPHIRIPDSIWRWIHSKKANVPDYMKKIFSDSLAGWPDDMVFLPLTDKYLIACPLEAKSRTGRFSSSKQRRMAKELNYQIPRSPVDVVNMINEFIDFATQLKKDIEECEEDQE
jgi:hypothetical protein